MNATFRFLAALSASVLATSIAMAEPVRTIDGELVQTEAYTVVQWSMHDARSVAELRTLSGRDDVLAVNVDAAGERSRIAPFLRRTGVDVAVVADPMGRIMAGGPAPELVDPGMMLAELERERRMLVADEAAVVDVDHDAR